MLRPASFAILSLLAFSAFAIEWRFPRDGNCHEGMAFSDGVTGVLVWGGGDTVKLTVSRGDLWDHRNGSEWTAKQSYTNIIAAILERDIAKCESYFAQSVPPGTPRNPLLLPLGRVVVRFPGKTLASGALDPFTGLGRLVFSDGGKVELVMGKSASGGCFALKTERGSNFTVKGYSSMEFERVFKSLTPIGYAMPRKLAGGIGGFVWNLPGGERPVALRWCSKGDEIFIRTTREEKEFLAPDGKLSFDSLAVSSVERWAEFWRKGAKVHLPDAELQDVFDYGMYRFGSMTDSSGTPAGLQGPWLEDHKRAPWGGDYHLNVNVQECYSPAYRSGHFENLMPLFRMILSWKPRMRLHAKYFAGIDDGYVLAHATDDRGTRTGGSVAGTLDHGSTMWIADMMFKYVKYSKDTAFLREHAYGFMEGAFNVAYAIMEKEGDELFYRCLPSPEWIDPVTRRFTGRNPSFQLAATHRLVDDLMEACAILGKKPDGRFAEVRKKLPRYCVGRYGIGIFDGQELDESHRHHSHLSGLFPFNTIDRSDPTSMGDAVKAYLRWVEKGHGLWTGWALPWAAVIHVTMGNAEAAVDTLRAWRTYFCDEGFGSHHNSVRGGFTALCGGRGVMQMDGHMGAVSAIMELMVHEVGGETEFFRGCPSSWKNVSFENIALSDGTRVSARRVDGKIFME